MNVAASPPDAQCDVTYEPVTDEDKEFFRRLNHRCYQDIVTRQFGEWDLEIQNRNFEQKWPTNSFLKIIVDGSVVGGVWVDEEAGYLQLREVQIDPDFQGRGYGTLAVKAVIARAGRAGKHVRLRVLHKNRAIRLYEKLGFRTTGSTETQFIMENN